MAEGVRHCKRPAADFRLAFTPGHRFQRGEWQYRMEVAPIAALCLPTGKIVAADPGNLDQRVETYFSQLVPPGTYPVDLAIRHTGKIGERMKLADTACMRVSFRVTPVADWVIATTTGQNLDDLEPFEIYGYGVDVGMGSFADSSGLVAVSQKAKAEGKKLYDEFYFEKVLPAYQATNGRYADILLDPSAGSNLVVCSSGHGDGFYASYWGLDGKGKPVCLVTDFGLLTHHVHETRQLGGLEDLLGRERRLKLPGGSLRLRIERPNARKLTIQMSGGAAGTCEVEFHRNGEKVHEKSATHSYGERGRSNELRFEKSIPKDVLVVVSYLDRIEPL
jgi:hypothetical protein